MDGVWDDKLISTMLPVAMELQADEAQMQYGAVSAAVSNLAGGKAAKAFRAGLVSVRSQARKAMRDSRGILNTDERISSAADSMLGLAEKLGIKVGGKIKGRGQAPTKPATAPTTIHGGPK